jgi:selenocysteine-specific elongation factor
VHRAVEADAASTLVAALTAFHDANPVRQGMDEADLRAAVADGTVCRLALDRLLRDGTVVHRGAVLGLAKRGARITEAEMATLEGLEARFRDAGLEPPPPDNADARLLRLLVDGGALVRLPDGQLMHRDAIARARDVALQLFRQAPAFTTMEFRDALGVSRKYAVPLLDYFDAHKVTVRNGNRRTPGSEAKRELGQAE